MLMEKASAPLQVKGETYDFFAYREMDLTDLEAKYQFESNEMDQQRDVKKKFVLEMPESKEDWWKKVMTDKLRHEREAYNASTTPIAPFPPTL